jgi:hypothetical protein
VAALSLWPGYVATERAVKFDKYKEIEKNFGFESPEFSGRVISAIYDDSDLPSLSGKTLLNAEIAERYGVTDLNGYKPQSLRALYGAPHKVFDAQ